MLTPLQLKCRLHSLKLEQVQQKHRIVCNLRLGLEVGDWAQVHRALVLVTGHSTSALQGASGKVILSDRTRAGPGTAMQEAESCRSQRSHQMIRLDRAQL